MGLVLALIITSLALANDPRELTSTETLAVSPAPLLSVGEAKTCSK